MSIPNGSTYCGLCSVEVVPLFTTSVAAQNGHLSELILGSSVDVAPQLSHFTVATSIFSSLLKLRARKSSRLISSISFFTSGCVMGFCAPQYSHTRLSVPGLNFK